jgi:hypothetical protein
VVTAPKFPPHTFHAGPPMRWTFDAGGSVSHVDGVPWSKSIACERCHATDGPASHAALAEFLHAHAGETCSSAKSGATRKR